MTKVWARELGPKGITVNAVAPGFIGTEMVRQMPEKILATMVERTPIRRLGEPKDVAYAYLFLASDEASFVNGIVLSVRSEEHTSELQSHSDIVCRLLLEKKK